MENRERKNLVVGISIGIFVVILLVLGLRTGWFMGKKADTGANQKRVLGDDPFRPENKNALQTIEGGTREKIANDVKTPDVNATGTPKNVATPTNVVETGNIAFRQFTIQGNGGAFVPSTIVVNEGDVVDLTLQAVDGDYSVFFSDFGVYGIAKKGETKKIQFQAPSYGKYTFVCNDVCKSVISGTLIVNKK